MVFTIGVCMYGGVSDLWTVLLAANLELSLVMSVMNTILASGKLEIHHWISFSQELNSLTWIYFHSSYDNILETFDKVGWCWLHLFHWTFMLPDNSGFIGFIDQYSDSMLLCAFFKRYCDNFEIFIIDLYFLRSH